MKQMTWGLIMATGKAEQISAEIETAFLYLNDRPVLAYSLAEFMNCPDIDGIVVVVSRDRAESVLGMVNMFGFTKVKKIVVGNSKRPASMAAGLSHMGDEVEWVCVHDASRPMVTSALISETVKSARRNGASVIAEEIVDPLVEGKKGSPVKRKKTAGRIWAAISPQTYTRTALMKAYPQAAKDRKNFQDDLEAMKSVGVEPRLVPTTNISLRIRSSDDLAPVLALMK